MIKRTIKSNYKHFFAAFALALAVVFLPTIFSSCKNKKPQIPEQLKIDDQNGIPEPILNVYNTTTKKVEEVPLETYILGVVAGEMPNDFPAEALKAQAILARTFTLYFVANRQSKYEGANISTDISEAQAYNPANINEAIIDAVAETQGKVLSYGGEFIETWFHSNSGGKTATTSEAWPSSPSDPEFIKMVTSPETEENSQNAVWSVWLSRSDMLSALSKLGKSVSTVSKISIAQKGPSGRATALKFGDTIVSAPEFRTSIGSTKLKSTYITDIVVDGSGATFSGKGYGHGVGLSQWGAKVMAEDGKDVDDILNHYFKDIKITDLY